MAGNADSTLNSGGTTGPGLTIGARYAVPGNPGSTQLGSYFAADRPDESAKQHIKDNNWRGIGFFPDANGNENLYVSKGSGGNGDDGLFQVLNGSFTKPTLAQVVNNGLGAGIPTSAKAPNSIVQLLGNYATNPTTNQPSPITPFGFFFANPTTLYVADEGNSTITLPTDSNETETSLTTDPLAGLQKWVLVPGSSPYWQLVYVIRDGLQINQPQKIPGYRGRDLYYRAAQFDRQGQWRRHCDDLCDHRADQHGLGRRARSHKAGCRHRRDRRDPAAGR